MAVKRFGQPGKCCCATDCPVACDPCALPCSLTLTLYYRQVTVHLSDPVTICADDEYTTTLHWDDGSPPSVCGACKPGYYYSDCMTVTLYADDSGSGCVFLGHAYVRWFLVCRADTNTITLIPAEVTYSSVYDPGPGLCEDWSPGSNWDGAIVGPISPVDAWETTAICDPFELRHQHYSPYDLFGSGDDGFFLSQDLWIYE